MQRQHQPGHLRSSCKTLSSKQLATFLFCAKTRFREKFSILAQIVISTSCISWRCMAVSSQSIAGVVASGWVPKIYTRVARAANKAFQPTRLRRAAESGVMRPKPVGHFCRIVLIYCWLRFASLSQAGEIVRCYLSLVLCFASRQFSSLLSCQNGWFKVGTCNACSGICADLQVHTRSA